jgi:hypothetical protein
MANKICGYDQIHKVFFEKLVYSASEKSFYGTQKFIAMFTNIHHWTLS